MKITPKSYQRFTIFNFVRCALELIIAIYYIFDFGFYLFCGSKLSGGGGLCTAGLSGLGVIIQFIISVPAIIFLCIYISLNLKSIVHFKNRTSSAIVLIYFIFDIVVLFISIPIVYNATDINTNLQGILIIILLLLIPFDAISFWIYKNNVLPLENLSIKEGNQSLEAENKSKKTIDTSSKLLFMSAKVFLFIALVLIALIVFFIFVFFI